MPYKLQELTFLLLSDIHFGASSFSPDFALEKNPPKHQVSGAVPMKASLIEVLSGNDFKTILVSGDLTSTGGPSEFDACVKVVQEIAGNLSVPGENVFFAFGNHDVDWRISRLGTEEGQVPDHLYFRIAGAVGPIFIQNKFSYKDGPTPGSGVFERNEFILYIINSGFFCSNNQNYRHGFLGSEQIEWLKCAITKFRGDPRWQILLLHHHPHNYSYPTHTEDISCLQEGAELLDLIGQSSLDIVCHGHRHHPILYTMMRNGWRAPVTFVCAGSLAVNAVERRLGEIPNLFHVVNLNSRTDSDAAKGTVKSYRYITSKGWIPIEYSAEVPMEPIQPFGSIATETEQREDAQRMIAALLKMNPDAFFVDLPPFFSLPYSLQCMSSHKLNALIREVAFISFARKVIGRYPDEQTVIRK